MEQTKSDTLVIIAAKQFLFRLGIKTFLSVIGIEADLRELDQLDDIHKENKSGIKSIFIIISQALLPQPKEQLKTIKNHFPKARIMVIGEQSLQLNSCTLVYQSDSQKSLLDKFHNFFSEPENNDENSEKSETILSEREIEILKTVARGLSNKEIAEELFISINTVISHRKNITEKLGIKTIAGLTVYAIMNNLIKPEEVSG